MNRYIDKTAVITGGNSGIGLATARRLKVEGARVVIVGRDASTLNAAAREYGFVSIRADLGTLAGIDRMYAEIATDIGKIDLLFANAGIYKTSPLGETSEAFFDEMVSVNLKGLFFTVQRALPHLENDASVVINTSAVTTKGWPGLAVYAASKAAARSLVRTFAAELLPRGIRVNAVSPGATLTPIFGRLGLSPEEIKATSDTLIAKIPARRLASAQDVAAGVAYLGSAEANYVVGAELAIDGGLAQI
jgi:NAD(P)-dependent dehydrogenase (short-subunit alcohol dehydrogenase family)